jgi:hypothetical protein
VSGARDQDASRWAEFLQAGSNVHPVTQEIVALDHDIPDVDTDAQDKPAFGTHLRVPLGQPRLNCRGAGHRVDDRRKLRDEAIAHQLDDAAVVFTQQGLQEGMPQMLHRGQRPGFVGFDEARVTDHIGNQYGGQPPLNLRQSHFSPALPLDLIAGHSGTPRKQ